jgi:hypothetical protein
MNPKDLTYLEKLEAIRILTELYKVIREPAETQFSVAVKDKIRTLFESL